MSISRESQYSRRRSNTVQSVFKVASTPLKHGESTVLTAWVHDPKDSPHVLLNHGAWPGVCEGDLLQLSQAEKEEQPGFLFVVPKEETGNKPQLQVRRFHRVRRSRSHFSSGILSAVSCGSLQHSQQHGSHTDQGLLRPGAYNLF